MGQNAEALALEPSAGGTEEAEVLEGASGEDDRPRLARLGAGGGRRGGDGLMFEPPTDDPFVAQELCETLYHVLWELVHVFFEHLGRSEAGAGASGFLYPFLERREADLGAVVEDVRRSALMKSEEVTALRAQPLGEGAEALEAAAAVVRRALDEGGTLLAFGNGGSATDAADVVADFRAAPHGWPARRAVDLTADSASLTALANDIGPEVLFARQLRELVER